MSTSPRARADTDPREPKPRTSRVRLGFVAMLFVGLGVLWWSTPAAGDHAKLWRTYGAGQFMANVIATLAVAAVAFLLIGGGTRRQRVFRVLLLGCILALCGLLLELPALLFRFDYRHVFGAPPGTTWLALSTGVNKRDPELLHIHYPDSAFEGAVFGNLAWLGFPDAPRHQVSVRYDKRGFRNAVDLDQAQVVAIGDSFIEAAIVALDQTVTERLSRHLATPVANLGQSAYGFQQEAATLRRFGVPLSPRLVLWFLFEGNDFRDAESYEEDRENLDRHFATPPFRERSFFRNAFFALSSATTPELERPTALALRRSAVMRGADAGAERIYFHDYGARDPEVTPGQWEVCWKALSEARTLCAEQKAQLLVILIPTKLRVYREYLEVAEGSDIQRLPVMDPSEKLAAWCAAQGIEFLDMTPPLKALVSNRQHPYFRDDTHWNETGHQAAADAIAAHLEGLGWKPAEGDR